MAAITELWRYPVKSMQGERVDAVVVNERGVVGDRRFALLDDEGVVVSAKHPRKWGDVLRYQARLIDADIVEIAGPDGTVVRSNDPEVDAVLSQSLGRTVTLIATPPDGARYEMLFLDVEGVAPADAIAATRTGDEEDGTMTAQSLGMAAPGTFVDVAPLHLLTTATLARLSTDVRRLRPNVLIDCDDDAFGENGWSGRTIELGADVRATGLLPTMRCVMTTLAQPGLPRDRGVLQTLARDNRVEIPGLGTWACAGAYCTVAAAGKVAVGDAVDVS
ncbi:MAG: MOSC N-terminal beta barrel domain-containing protein [Actinobacteria bacterium]|nr:MOSC N-terminal beta barrel domain-containing protein [Actinomycetota bacterium]